MKGRRSCKCGPSNDYRTDLTYYISEPLLSLAPVSQSISSKVHFERPWLASSPHGTMSNKNKLGLFTLEKTFVSRVAFIVISLVFEYYDITSAADADG